MKERCLGWTGIVVGDSLLSDVFAFHGDGHKDEVQYQPFGANLPVIQMKVLVARGICPGSLTSCAAGVQTEPVGKT